MKIPRNLLVIAATAVAGICFASAAQAQASRTWVSGTGLDTNPCSRTQPCLTFAGAFANTLAGGEINVLDPGGYGNLTINKSISIYNDGAGEAGIVVSGVNAIVINAGATDVVNLRGLTLNGQGGNLESISFPPAASASRNASFSNSAPASTSRQAPTSR